MWRLRYTWGHPPTPRGTRQLFTAYLSPTERTGQGPSRKVPGPSPILFGAIAPHLAIGKSLLPSLATYHQLDSAIPDSSCLSPISGQSVKTTFPFCDLGGDLPHSLPSPGAVWSLEVMVDEAKGCPGCLMGCIYCGACPKWSARPCGHWTQHQLRELAVRAMGRGGPEFKKGGRTGQRLGKPVDNVASNLKEECPDCNICSRLSPRAA